MAGLRDLNSKLDYFWSEYSRRFPGFFYQDENGSKTKPLIVPGEVLRRDAPLYMRRLVDQDPTSYYFMMQANPLKGAADRDTAVEFFHDFFVTKLGMKSSYSIDSGMRPTRENPDFGTLDPFSASDREVLPAKTDADYQKYYDEQMAKADAEAAAKQKVSDDKAFQDKFGFDRNDPNIIDIDLDEPAKTTTTSDVQTRDTNASAVALPKNIFYAVDFHMPAGMELGYDGGRNGVGGRQPGRLGSRGVRRLREASDSNELTPVEIGKKIKDLVQRNSWKADVAEDIEIYLAPKSNDSKIFPITDIQVDSTDLFLTSGISSKSQNFADLAKAIKMSICGKISRIAKVIPKIVGLRGFDTRVAVVDVIETEGGIAFVVDHLRTSTSLSNVTTAFDETEDEVTESPIPDEEFFGKDVEDSTNVKMVKAEEFFEPVTETDEGDEDSSETSLNESFSRSQLTYWNNLIKCW